MNEIAFKIDWLSITIHTDHQIAEYIWKQYFQDALGQLQDKGHGGRGFRRLQFAELGAKVYSQPTNEGSYFHIELPGQACACLLPQTFTSFFRWLVNMEDAGADKFKFKVTRIDFAFDNVPFTPEIFRKAIEDNRVRSLTQRESLKVIDSPYKMREDESGFGCMTVYFGSSQSARKVRVYNKRGPTRLELELRHVRADYVARAVMVNGFDKWLVMAVSHVRDFMDIYETEARENLASWWAQFIEQTKRAYLKVYSAKELSKERIENWFETQICTWLFVLRQKEPEFLDEIAKEGARRLKPHHRMVLAA